MFDSALANPANLLAQSASILFGQQSDADAAGLVFVLIILVFALVITVAMIAITIMILLFLQRCFERIPPQYRETEPWQVWLMLIPFFNIVWIFFIYPKLAQAYQRYFYAMGRYDVGDCGYQLALWYCILSCCSMIPYIGVIPGMAGFIVWIIFLVKAKELRDQIPVHGQMYPQTPMNKPAGWA